MTSECQMWVLISSLKSAKVLDVSVRAFEGKRARGRKRVIKRRRGRERANKGYL